VRGVVATVPRPRRPGRPPLCQRETVIRAIQLHNQGLSYQKIADVLNAEGRRTPESGSLWLKSSVNRLLYTQYAGEMRGEVEENELECG
jgi:hypothetical protein